MPGLTYTQSWSSLFSREKRDNGDGGGEGIAEVGRGTGRGRVGEGKM